MNKNKIFKKMCTPAKIYFCIAIIVLVYELTTNIPISLILGKLFFTFLSTFILSLLCKNGFKFVSWFLMLFLVLYATKIIENHNIFNESIEGMRTSQMLTIIVPLSFIIILIFAFVFYIKIKKSATPVFEFRPRPNDYKDDKELFLKSYTSKYAIWDAKNGLI